MTDDPARRDVFLSYASEQRGESAQPLAELLTDLGLAVWYDQFEIRLGDSLHRKIDEGLASCRYGIVLLSHAFFAKHHTRRELTGLAQREVDGEEVILPVWIDVEEQDVRRHSPPLADRKAIRWDEGLYAVGKEILKVVRPDLAERYEGEIARSQLRRVTSGHGLGRLLGARDFTSIFNDSPEGEDEVALVASFAQEVRDWSEIWSQLEPADHIEAEFRLNQRIREVERCGWCVFASRSVGERELMGHHGIYEGLNVALIRGNPVAALVTPDGLVIVRRPAEKNKFDEV